MASDASREEKARRVRNSGEKGDRKGNAYGEEFITRGGAPSPGPEAGERHGTATPDEDIAEKTVPGGECGGLWGGNSVDPLPLGFPDKRPSCLFPAKTLPRDTPSVLRPSPLQTTGDCQRSETGNAAGETDRGDDRSEKNICGEGTSSLPTGTSSHNNPGHSPPVIPAPPSDRLCHPTILIFLGSLPSSASYQWQQLQQHSARHPSHRRRTTELSRQPLPFPLIRCSPFPLASSHASVSVPNST